MYQQTVTQKAVDNSQKVSAKLLHDRPDWPLCQAVEIITTQGKFLIPGWRYGAFAAHTGIHETLRQFFAITHLPTGGSFAPLGVFTILSNAILTMIDLSHLNVDLASMGSVEIRPLLPMIKICFARHNPIYVQDAGPANVLARPTMNGHEERP